MTKIGKLNFVLSFAAILVMHVFASGALAVDIDNLDNHFLKLEQRLMTAVVERDRENMDAMIGNDYLLTSSDSNGAFLSKAQYISGAMSPDLLTAEGFEFKQLQVQKIDDQAVIVRSQLDWRSNYRGRPWNAEFLMTDIWVLRDDRWQLISRHSSYPANELPRIVDERYSAN